MEFFWTFVILMGIAILGRYIKWKIKSKIMAKEIAKAEAKQRKLEELERRKDELHTVTK